VNSSAIINFKFRNRRNGQDGVRFDFRLNKLTCGCEISYTLLLIVGVHVFSNMTIYAGKITDRRFKARGMTRASEKSMVIDTG